MRHALVGLALAALAACAPGEEPPIQGAALPVVKTDGGAEMVLIPEGDFEMGSARGRDVEKPVHKVHLDAFLMDRTEVTGDANALLGRLADLVPEVVDAIDLAIEDPKRETIAVVHPPSAAPALARTSGSPGRSESER